MAENGKRGRLGRAALAAFAVVLAASVAGCGGGLPKNPFKKEEEKLPGERIAVMPEAQLHAEAPGRPVELPGAIANSSWSQPGGNAGNSLGHLAFSGDPHKIWQASAGEGSSKYGRLSAVPIVVGDRIFTLDSEGQVSAFSASSGAKIWEATTTPKGESASEGFGGGLAMGSQYLYATTGFGTVVAFDPGSGAIAWTKRTGEPIRSSPTAADGKVFFVSTDSQLHCLNGATGEELWKRRGLPQPASLLSNVSPAVSSRIVLAPYPAGDITAFAAGDGTPKWNESLAGSTANTASGVLADPARPVINGGVVFAISHGGRMIAASESSGSRMWSKSLGSTQMPWAAGGSVFIVDTGGNLMALSRKDGEIQWVQQLPKSTRWSGPVLAGGKLWLVSGAGLLVGADARTGQVVSKLDLDTPVYISPIVVAGRMYILSDEAELIALQ